jgi:hypothetical protein
VRRGELPADLAVEIVVRLVTAASYGLTWFHGLLASQEEHDEVLRAFQALLQGRLLQRRDTQEERT